MQDDTSYSAGPFSQPAAIVIVDAPRWHILAQGMISARFVTWASHLDAIAATGLSVRKDVATDRKVVVSGTGTPLSTTLVRAAPALCPTERS
jgi:hypothetical protein